MGITNMDYQNTFLREDGSEVKVIAWGTWFPEFNLAYDVLYRKCKADNWITVRDADKLKYVSKAELLKTGDALYKMYKNQLIG